MLRRRDAWLLLMDVDGILMMDKMMLVRERKQYQGSKEHLQEIPKADDLPSIEDFPKSQYLRNQEDNRSCNQQFPRPAVVMPVGLLQEKISKIDNKDCNEQISNLKRPDEKIHTIHVLIPKQRSL